jgi:hypothetical protein
MVAEHMEIEPQLYLIPNSKHSPLYYLTENLDLTLMPTVEVLQVFCNLVACSSSLEVVHLVLTKIINLIKTLNGFHSLTFR